MKKLNQPTTDKLSFVDYFRICKTLESSSQAPTTLITRHDDELLTYKEAYKTLSLMFDDLTHLVNYSNQLTIQTVTYLWETLDKQGILSDDDYKQLQHILEEQHDGNN